MRKKIILLVLSLLLITIFTSIVQADNKLMGTLKLNDKKPMHINNKQYVPLDKVASTIGFDLDWHLSGNKVRGTFNGVRFTVDNFIIYHGQLYIPIDFFENYFNLVIKVNGNIFYVYRLFDDYREIDVELQTNKDEYDKGEPIAVSLLLFNDNDDTTYLEYSSGKKYDLVLKRFGREVWRYSRGQGFTMAFSNETFRPYEYKLYTLIISPYKDKYIPRGTYQLQAKIPTTSGKIYSSPVTIEID